MRVIEPRNIPYRRAHRPNLPWGSLLILSTLFGSAVFANVIAPFDPLQTNLPMRLTPPAFQTGNWTYVLGTDDAGRDILSRIIFGARTSLLLAGASLIVGASIGTCIGLVAGYAGGLRDVVLMRITDLTLSYPVILLALLLSVALGPRTANVIVAISFILWARFARVVRGEALLVKEQPYVDAARTVGASPSRIVVRHVLPNLANTIMVLASLQLGWVILVEASLSFLGAGVPPPEPAWGSMTALGRDYVVTAWWVPTMPGIAIMLTVLALNLLGDWLRDRLDPRLRRAS
jgi:peptide/nickel transport system permease protein